MGTRSFGRYIAGKHTRRGEHVETYAALDGESDRSVAIRVPLPRQPLADSDTLRGQLQQLSAFLAELRHPFIARVYGVGMEQGQLYWAIEDMPDDTLADRLASRRSGGPIAPLPEIARQLAQLAAALDYAHAHGAIHGGLSPISVLLNDLDEPVLVDFGVAALLGAGWASTLYMSPEQAAGQPATARSDVYALGMIVYELATGKLPAQTRDNTMRAARLLPRAVSPELPRAIGQVILKTLAEHPAERYASAGELAGAFAAALQAASVAEGAAAHDQEQLASIGRYQILANLGRRGNLTVYSAYDPELERQVAVKILHGQVADDQLRARFQREIELIAAIEHHAIVEVYDFGLHDGQPFVVMPFMAGGTLAYRLASAAMSPRQFVPIIDRVAEALDAVHQRGRLHRQLKPTNILFDDRGQAYLSDISIAAIADSPARLTDQHELDDMAAYMSPEQVRALAEAEAVALDARSDVYSLGAILFELLSGAPPYQAKTGAELAKERVNEAIPRLRSADPAALRVYQPIVDRALASDPSDRYATAGMLARDVREAASGRWYLRALIDEAEDEPIRRAQPDAPLVQAPAAETPATSGSRSIGRYQIERELGRGGMAVVFLAYDPQIKRSVAIKVLPAQFMTAPAFRSRFRHEAEIVARLRHGAIVSIYDFGEHGDQIYIVMRHLSGGTLADRLASGPIRLQELSPMIERVAAALDEAHAQGIIHNDVKPANIIFDQNGAAFLSDFGIAVLSEAAATLPESIGFTPKYISPERVRALKDKVAAEADGRSDVYALGVVLFEAMTGQAPFQAGDAAALAMAHLNVAVPRISTIKPDLPEACQQIVDRALAKHPDDRYQSAGALAQDVKELASNRWFLRKLLD
jgi:serine/threonine protein kinase